MGVTSADLQEIHAKIAPVLDTPAWGVKLGVGSFITIEFGPSRTREGAKHAHGEWHLWVYYCAWRLDQENDVLAASEDPRPTMEAAVRRLEGQALRSVEVSAPALETTFRFSDGLVLRLFPIYSQEYEHWMFYTPDGHVLTIGPGTSWTYQSSSAVPS